MEKHPPSPYLVLLVGVLAVAAASIFINFAQLEGVPSLVIAAMRMSLSALFLTPLALRGHRPALRSLSRRDLLLALTSGALLAVHFATWITSLEHTSVMISVVLVTTNPLWVALFSPLLLRQSISRRTWIGILFAFAGGILISLTGGEIEAINTGANPLLGGILALMGAIAAGLYFIIGQRLRASLALIPYIWICYGASAIFLLIAVLFSGQSLTGYSPVAYLWMLLLAIIPQLIGHSSFNYALGHLPASYVSLVIPGEPVGSTILAAIFLNQIPVPAQFIGAGLILFGVIYAVQQKKKRAVDPEKADQHGFQGSAENL